MRRVSTEVESYLVAGNLHDRMLTSHCHPSGMLPKYGYQYEREREAKEEKNVVVRFQTIRKRMRSFSRSLTDGTSQVENRGGGYKYIMCFILVFGGRKMVNNDDDMIFCLFM